MKYLVIQTNTSTVLDTYLSRNVGAVVKKLKSYQKIYCPEERTKDYFGSLVRFKHFCINALPFIKNEKLKSRIYRANVELITI